MFGTATVGPRRFGVSWLVAIYLIAGGIVAATHDYWSNLNTSLLLVGINLHIH